MSLGKQAKVLTDNQQKAVLGCIAARRHAARNTLMFLLSVDAGLRSKEIALLDWSMLTDCKIARNFDPTFKVSQRIDLVAKYWNWEVHLSRPIVTPPEKWILTSNQ